MITGVVTPDRMLLVRLPICGPAGSETEVEAIIDTGYNGTLTLPLDVIHQLSLTAQGSCEVTLADGSTADLDIFRATVVWDDLPMSIELLAAEGGAAIGMTLLPGYRVCFDAVDGGPVTIMAIP